MQAAHEIINIRWQTLYYLEKGSNREFWTPRDESVFQPGSLLRSVNVYHSERFHSIHASFLAPFRMGHQTLSTKVMMTLIQKLWYATAGKRGLFFFLLTKAQMTSFIPRLSQDDDDGELLQKIQLQSLVAWLVVVFMGLLILGQQQL